MARYTKHPTGRKAGFSCKVIDNDEINVSLLNKLIETKIRCCSTNGNTLLIAIITISRVTLFTDMLLISNTLL